MWQPEPILYACAPNGARRGKADHRALPEGPAEMAQCAAEIAEAGAAMLHLHVRDENGGHSLDPGRYREAMSEIRRAVGDRIVVQITTEAVGIYSPGDQRRCVLEVGPEAVSLALTELIPHDDDIADARHFHARLNEQRIFVQHIVYSPNELARLRRLWRSGVFGEQPPFVLLVLGRYLQGQQSNPADLLPFLPELPEGSSWMACAFGRSEAAVMLLAASLGGHARIGFENNLVLGDGTLAASNADLIAHVSAAVTSIGRSAMTASQLRANFFLPQP